MKSASRPARSLSAKKPRTATEQLSTAQTVAWYCLLALVFLVPLATTNLSLIGGSRLTYVQFDLIKSAIMGVLAVTSLAAWAWHLAVHGGKIRYTPVDAVIAAFVAWSGFSALFSVHPPTALLGSYGRYEGVVQFATYLVLYFVTMQLADRYTRMQRIAQTLFWSSLGVAALGALQFLGLDWGQWGQLSFESNRAFATFGNPDLLAGFLCFSTLIALGLALSEKRSTWRSIYWAGFLLNSFVMVGTFVRGAWIGFAVGLAVFAVFAWRQNTQITRLDLTWGAGALLGVLAATVGSLRSQSEVTNVLARLSSIAQLDSGSARTRFEIWDAAMASVADKPIVGFGADTFRLVFPLYKPAEYVRDAGFRGAADNVHNYPLELASGVGVPGAALLYAAFAWAAVRSGRALWSMRASAAGTLLVGFWAACAAYLVHLMFGLSVVGATTFLWVSLGLVLSPTASSIDVERHAWLRVAAGVATAMAVGTVAVWGGSLAADRASLLSQTTTGTASIEYARSAIRLNPYTDIYRTRLDLALTSQFVEQATQVSSLRAAGDAAGADSMALASRATFEQAEKALLESIAFAPIGEQNHHSRLANLYLVAADVLDPAYVQRAVDSARRGVEVEPTSPEAHYILAFALEQQGSRNDAIDSLRTARSLDPRYEEAAFLLGKLLGRAGSYDEALSVLREAQALDPNDTRIPELVSSIEASTSAR